MLWFFHLPAGLPSLMPRRQAPQDRLKAIETLLLWEGRVTNSRLREFFAVHSVQASRDLTAYRERAEHNCHPVPGERGYRATEWVKPVLTEGSFREYQQLVGAAATEGGLQTGIPSESVLEDATHTSLRIFPVVHAAIRTGQGVDIEYQSLRHPEGTRRRIFPHALIQAGVRWHVRAYCERAHAFRDFNLGRMRSATAIPINAPATCTDDLEWNTPATLRLRPHQALTAAQSQMIRLEYFEGTVGLALTRRAPLVPYLIQAYRAALVPDRELPPAFLLQVHEPEQLPPCACWSETSEDGMGRG